MTNTLRIVLVIVILLYFCIIFGLLKRRSLALKYTLLWLLMGLVMAIFVIFPNLLSVVGRAVGIVDNMNALFTAAIGFAFCILMALTSIVSKQSSRIKRLIQENALLEKRLRELEDKLPSKDEDKNSTTSKEK